MHAFDPRRIRERPVAEQLIWASIGWTLVALYVAATWTRCDVHRVCRSLIGALEWLFDARALPHEIVDTCGAPPPNCSVGE